jgi:hypothetical protein
MLNGSPTGSGATIPILRRSSYTVPDRRTSSSSTLMVPATRASGEKSIVRLMHRSSDVFPDCDGPITPKISFR